MELSKDLVLVVDELLDAYDDTVRLSETLVLDWRWQAHLCYLRELARLSREALAAATREDGSNARRAPVRLQWCQTPQRPGGSTRFRSMFLRRGDRRCARDGHGEGSA